MQKQLKSIILISTLLFSMVSVAEEMIFPPLPTKGFVSGRIATQADVEKGDAAFASLPEQHIVRHVMPLPVPQYAIFRGGEKSRVVFVIQIEKVNGKVTIGARYPEGGEALIGTTKHFSLLGTSPKQ